MSKNYIFVGVVIGICDVLIEYYINYYDEQRCKSRLWLYDYSPSKMLAGSTRFKEQEHD